MEKLPTTKARVRNGARVVKPANCANDHAAEALFKHADEDGEQKERCRHGERLIENAGDCQGRAGSDTYYYEATRAHRGISQESAQVVCTVRQKRAEQDRY